MKKFSRQELLNPIRNIVTAMHPRKEEVVDSVTEFASEIALVAAAIWVAYEGGKDRLVSVHPAPVRTLAENSQFINGMNSEVFELVNGLSEIQNTISQLQNNWRRAYLKTRTVPVIKYDEDNDPYMVLEDQDYWDEPNELTNIGLNRSNISGLSSLLGSINNATNGLVNNAPQAASIQIDGRDSYRHNVTEIDLKDRNIMATFGLGSSAVIFAFYEEIYTGLMQDGNYRRVQKLSERSIKRRSFLKLALGGTALIPTAKLHQALVSENAVVERRVKASTRDALNNYGSINDLELFKIHFGNSIDSILQQLENYFAIIDTAVDTGNGHEIESWDRIVTELTTLRSQLTAYKARLQIKLQPNGESEVPDNLALGMRNLTTHRQVMDESASINNSPGANALIQTLTFAGLLFGVAFSTEALILVQEEITKSIS